MASERMVESETEAGRKEGNEELYRDMVYTKRQRHYREDRYVMEGEKKAKRKKEEGNREIKMSKEMREVEMTG